MTERRFWNSWIDPVLGLAARSRARLAYQRVLQEAQEAVRCQDAFLLDQIQSHAESQFGRDHDFSRIRNYEDFRKAVPIRDYEQMRPYVQSVMDGDEGALFGRGTRVLMFAMTSGSTDRPKYIPITRKFVRAYRRGWSAFGGKAMLDHPDSFMRGILQVTSPFDVERTGRGVPCGSISGLLAREQTTIVRKYYVTPPEVAEIGDAEARYYTIMRFAVPTDVAWIVTASPATPLKLARTALDHAERLIRDVRNGTLNPPRAIPTALANSLESRLHPDRQGARRLEACISRAGALLPKDYWRLSFMGNWTGGTLALHLREFPAFFGDTPVREIGLLATEGRVSIGLDAGNAAGLMDPGAGFFEFAEKDSQNGTGTWRCHELEEGGEYRVILTTAAGLYRYDIGDCVRVCGYVGQAPLLEFLHRGARVSSLCGEKLTEWQVTKAMGQIAAEHGLRCRHFMLAPAWGDPPYYRLHVDQRKGDLNGLAQLFDSELMRFNMEYAGKRESGRLGCVKVNEVSEGVLGRWEERCMQRHQAGEQYKHQYLLPGPDLDGVLMEMNHVTEELASRTMDRPTEMEAGRAFP